MNRRVKHPAARNEIPDTHTVNVCWAPDRGYFSDVDRTDFRLTVVGERHWRRQKWQKDGKRHYFPTFEVHQIRAGLDEVLPDTSDATLVALGAMLTEILEARLNLTVIPFKPDLFMV